MEEPLDRSLGGEDARTLSAPLLNVLNGGTHATNNVASQEFMIVPADARSFHKALRIGAEIFAARKRLLQEKGLTTAVGDEGGVAATEFYDNGEYIFRKADGVVRIAADLVELYRRWAEQYPLMSIEDGLAEDNWDGWR